MCKTFNVVPFSLTYPSRINLKQTNNFTVKSVERVFHSFDSLIACRCNDYLQDIRNSACWQLNSTSLILSRLFQNNWTHRHRIGDSCTHSPPKNCASRHLLHHLVHHNFQPRRIVASGVGDRWQGDFIDLPNPKMFNNGHTFRLMLLKSFKTLHGLSRWRTKLAILLSKPLQKFWAEAGWRRCFCTRTVVLSLPTSFFNATLRRNRFTF